MINESGVSCTKSDAVFRTVDTATSNLDVYRFSITLDDTFRCLVKFPCNSGYILRAEVIPAFKFPFFGGFVTRKYWHELATDFLSRS